MEKMWGQGSVAPRGLMKAAAKALKLADQMADMKGRRWVVDWVSR